MRVVVTGASGTVGTALLRRLIARAGDFDVTGVVRRPPPRENPYDSVRWHALDLADGAAPLRLRHVLAGVDVVVHLAWSPPSVRDVERLYTLGVGGSTAVVEAAHVAGVAHLIHLSSACAYAPGNPGGRVDETWSTSGMPTSHHSLTKSAIETQLDDYDTRRSGMVTTRVRPAVIVSDDTMRLLRTNTFRAADEALTSVVHVDDVADALVRIVDGRHGGAFNLAAEPPVSRVRLAALLRARSVDGAWVRSMTDTAPLDTTRAREALGWTSHDATSRPVIASGATARSPDPAPPGTRP